MSNPLTDQEIELEIQTLSDWTVEEVEGIKRLSKAFSFKNFAEALTFTNQVGALAEEQDHHPEIITEWGKVTVVWWTHTVKGLTRGDFSMAKKVDEL